MSTVDKVRSLDVLVDASLIPNEEVPVEIKDRSQRVATASAEKRLINITRRVTHAILKKIWQGTALVQVGAMAENPIVTHVAIAFALVNLNFRQKAGPGFSSRLVRRSKYEKSNF